MAYHFISDTFINLHKIKYFFKTECDIIDYL